MITFIVLALLCLPPALAQVITSSVSGTVVDSEKAVIPGAAVSVRGSQGDLVRSIKSNADGFFQITDLQPGTYSVTVESKGFGEVTEANVIVTAAKDVSLGEFVLKPGEVQEVVTVTSVTNGVDTESPNNEASLSTEELEKIRVRSDDIMEALTLLPGNTDTASGTRDAPNANSVANIYTNGVRSNSKNIMIDGVATMDPMSGAFVNTLPSIDMVQELKIMATNYRADSGRNAGPSVIIITKPGSQVVHGSFDFPFRNEFFNANTPDAKRLGQPRAPYRLLLPSYTVTGPILIPHLISRQSHLFFTISQQLQIQSSDPQPTVKYASMPTALERQGNFSQSFEANGHGSIADTFSTPTISWCNIAGLTSGCTGSQIPTKYQTAQGLAILNLFPQPNTPFSLNAGTTLATGTVIDQSSYNYESSSLLTTHRNTNLARIDWQPSTRFSMYVRAMYTPETDESGWDPGTNTSGGYSNMGWNIGNFTQRSIGTGLLVSFTNTFSSSLVNTVGLGVSTREAHGYAENPGGVLNSALSAPLPSLFPGTNTLGYLPDIGFGCPVTGEITSCTPTWQYNDLPSYALDPSFPSHTHVHSFSITDNATKVLGTHSLVGGLYFEESHVNSLATGIINEGLNNRGNYSFEQDPTNPCDTGDPFANILVGCIDSYSQASARPEMYGRFHNMELYVQDEWRAKPRLTLSMGMRFYHDPPAFDALNQIYDFVPSLYQASMAPRLWYPAYCVSTCGTYTNSCIAALNGKTIPTGAYAVDAQTGSSGPSGCRGFIVQGSSPLPNPLMNGMVRAGTNGIPRSIFTTPFLSYGPRFGFNWAMTGDGKTILKGGMGIYYDRFPLQDQLNLMSNPPTVTQEAVNDISGYSQLAGLGSSGQIAPPNMDNFALGQHPLPTNHSYSLEMQRQISRDGTLGVAYVGNVSQHIVAAQSVNNAPLYSQLYELNPQNIDPSSCAPASITAKTCTPTMLSVEFLSPYKGFDFVQNQYLGASANYNSMQVSYAQRLFHRHVQLRGNYTLGHTLGDASQDNTRVASQPEPLSFYGPLQYDRRDLINFWYIVEFPDPGRLLDSRFLSILGRSWSASGIYRFSTGAPFTPSLDLESIAHAGGAGISANVASAITGSTDGARPVLLSASAKFKPGDSDNKFTGPALGSWGNTGYAEFNLPHWEQFDVTLYRTFHPTEKFLLTFRTEAYNVPNSTLVSTLNTVLQYNYLNGGMVPVGGNINPGFFTANSGGGVNGQNTVFFRNGRIIQFDLSGRF